MQPIERTVNFLEHENRELQQEIKTLHILNEYHIQNKQDL
jgi:hypothetical protein